mgnify:CR=1 FL=1
MGVFGIGEYGGLPMKMGLVIVICALIAMVLLIVELPCKVCGGKGILMKSGTDRVPCSFCSGRGRITPEMKKPADVKSTFKQENSACPRCNGLGYREEMIRGERPCFSCKGKGTRGLYQWLFDRTGL